jgi:uncharacterized protein
MSTEQPHMHAPAALTQDDRTWGMIAHLAALTGLLITVIGNVLGPLVVWLMKREQSAFVAESAREALNFNITVFIGYCACGLLIPFLIGIPLAAALFVYWLVMTIIAGVKAGEGLHYRYPVTLRLVK